MTDFGPVRTGGSWGRNVNLVGSAMARVEAVDGRVSLVLQLGQEGTVVYMTARQSMELRQALEQAEGKV